MIWFCGVRVMKMSQRMLALSMSKETEATKKKNEEIEVETTTWRGSMVFFETRMRS